jgi:hypothetical protein
LIERGTTKVLRTVANNPGAELSDPSFAMLVQKASTMIGYWNASLGERTFLSITFEISSARRRKLSGKN